MSDGLQNPQHPSHCAVSSTHQDTEVRDVPKSVQPVQYTYPYMWEGNLQYSPIHILIKTLISIRPSFKKERKSNPGSGPPLVSSNTWWGFRSFRKLYKISLPFSPPLLGLTKTSRGQLPLASLLCCWERKEPLLNLVLNCTVVSHWATRGTTRCI